MIAPVFWILGLFHSHHVRMPLEKAQPIAEALATHCQTVHVAEDGGDHELVKQSRLKADVLLKLTHAKNLSFDTICPKGQ